MILCHQRHNFQLKMHYKAFGGGRCPNHMGELKSLHRSHSWMDLWGGTTEGEEGQWGGKGHPILQTDPRRRHFLLLKFTYSHVTHFRPIAFAYFSSRGMKLTLSLPIRTHLFLLSLNNQFLFIFESNLRTKVPRSVPGSRYLSSHNRQDGRRRSDRKHVVWRGRCGPRTWSPAGFATGLQIDSPWNNNRMHRVLEAAKSAAYRTVR